MKLFGKKKDFETNDPLFKSPDPLGPPDALGLSSDGFGSSGTIEHSEPRSMFAPMNVLPPQTSQSPSFAPQQAPSQNIERELQLINSKLDTLKAQLDALSLRLGQQAQKQNEERPRKTW
jgi:hypothetical protein